MITEALVVRMEAKPGKEEAVAAFLKEALAAVEAEQETAAWFAVRMGPSTFGVFDAFPDERGRRAHLVAGLGAALQLKAPELLERPPLIEEGAVLAAKLPH